MIPAKLKSLIDNYCMGVNPSNEKMDEILDLAAVLDADSSEVAAYMKKMISGPTKAEREAEAKKRAQKAKENAARKAKKEAELRAAIEGAKHKILDSKEPCVDLGLSVKWATCNLGASKPCENGDYFAWGETRPKDKYDWDSYELSDESDNINVIAFSKTVGQKKLTQEMLKYCSQSHQGDVDNLVTLELEDDASYVNMKRKWRFWEKCKWRTPTIDEWNELKDNCEWTWTILNGKNGFIVRAKNGNCIFLPAAGYKEKSKILHANDGFRYWSSSLDQEYNYYAQEIQESPLNPLYSIDWGSERCIGLPIRPVQD